jgi:hypothetical protein
LWPSDAISLSYPRHVATSVSQPGKSDPGIALFPSGCISIQEFAFDPRPKYLPLNPAGHQQRGPDDD